MKSAMVLWLYHPQQYSTNTPINEIAEHAELNGFNDEPVEVLCLHGYEFIPAADVARLARQNFFLRDVAPLYAAVAGRYPNLRRRYQNHFFECFLRWIVLKEFYRDEPILAWDADIFFNEKLSAIHEAFGGSTFTSSSTCFVALHDAGWLRAYQQQLDVFERDPAAFLAAIFADLGARRELDQRQFSGCFFGDLVAAALDSQERWETLFDSTPEEMFVDYLVRTGRLPHHFAKGESVYLLCPQPLILPLLAWVHPMGEGLAATAVDLGAPTGFEKRGGCYCYNGRPLAFLHFQGAVFRACAVYQILYRFIDHPTKIHDPFYCPLEIRAGLSVPWFFDEKNQMRQKLSQLRNARELLELWGDPFSERAIARNFLIRSSLTEVLASYCLEPAAAPAG